MLNDIGLKSSQTYIRGVTCHIKGSHSVVPFNASERVPPNPSQAGCMVFD